MRPAIPRQITPATNNPIVNHNQMFEPAFAPIQIQMETMAAQHMLSQPSVRSTSAARRYLSTLSPARNSTKSVIRNPPDQFAGAAARELEPHFAACPPVSSPLPPEDLPASRSFSSSPVYRGVE